MTSSAESASQAADLAGQPRDASHAGAVIVGDAVAALAEESAASASVLVDTITELKTLLAQFRTNRQPEPVPLLRPKPASARAAAPSAQIHSSPPAKRAAGGGGWDAF